MKDFKSMAITTLAGIIMLAGCTDSESKTKTENSMQTLNLTQEWDKVFPQSDKVNHSKITFSNRYGITLAADMYVPKNAM